MSLSAGPIVVQSDGSLLLDVHHPAYEEARDFLMAFSELEKSPEHFHTYRMGDLSLWNAASLGLCATDILEGLARLGRYDMPATVARQVRDTMAQYGRIRLVESPTGLVLEVAEAGLLYRLRQHKNLAPILGDPLDDHRVAVASFNRGFVKQILLTLRHPVEDLAGYDEGAPLALSLKPQTSTGAAFGLRGYQTSAVEAFYRQGSPAGGSGVVVLPCGAGKTAVGLGVMAKIQNHTLVLTPTPWPCASGFVKPWITPRSAPTKWANTPATKKTSAPSPSPLIRLSPTAAKKTGRLNTWIFFCGASGG